MPFYIRKALSVGPFRFNLSKSGIGVSVGVRGLRVGSGARGNYVHAGRQGIYYRKSLPGKPVGTATIFRDLTRNGDTRDSETQRTQVPQQTTQALEEIDSQSALQMVDSTSEELLLELNEKRKYTSIWPWFLASTLLATVVTIALGLPIWTCGAVAIVGVLLVLWGFGQDQMGQHAILMYDLDDEKRAQYEHLCDAFEEFSHVGRVWHVAARAASTTGDVVSTATLRRVQIFPAVGQGPKHLKANVPVPCVPVGSQSLYFLPDRVLVHAPEGYGAVGYPDLELSITHERFAEQEMLPADANVVDQTWASTTKSGDPDRRFTSNREIPIILYEGMHLSSQSGLNELVQYSRTGFGSQIRKALLDLDPDLSRKAEDRRREAHARLVAEKSKEKAMSKPKSLRAVFQKLMDSGQLSGSDRLIAGFLASSAISKEAFAKFVADNHLSSEPNLKGTLIDLAIEFAQECVSDHELANTEIDELLLLTEIFEIEEGEFLKYRRQEVQAILESQTRWILEDRYVTDREEIAQRDLQRLFGLSYDDFVRMLRPLAERYVNELVARKTKTQEERESVASSIQNLRGVFLIPK